MQNFRRVFVFFLSLFFFSLTTQVFAATSPDPTEQLKPVIDKVVSLLKDANFRKRPIVDQSEVIVKIVSERFDFREMSKRVMGKQWRTLKPEQQDQFVGLFTKLLQYVYINQVDDYLDKKIEFTGQRIKRDRAEVKTLLVAQDKSIPVSYIMLLEKDSWMAYDIAVEGVSLIRNYMEQINTVLRDEKFTGLISMLEKKITKLEAGEKDE
ncbi:MAG: ABC transporter substrate-binding protein [Candidatus Electrothrix sp. AX5]|jgi:phospholipid transport system substrate-binding protein|uniref:Phospholipid transport system substrate-binding protein n=1 Tax=Candidatus Electrothrix aarhusensis TaxID=1859131 RepID=A0A3S3SIR9_9BACT|nr:ABC transporter substrate-binding protein [Candidatus Electrothrix sp. AX5]RWX43700.1 phospholipid transport system substrate-binding protein [Candidatus Electrothrix aarhusensis]